MALHVATRRALAWLTLMCATGVAAGCGPQVTVHTAANPAASFNRYATFSFGREESPPRGFQRSPHAPEVERRLEGMISVALAQRGYTLVPGRGDFVVEFGAGRRDVVVHDSSDDVAGEWQPDDENADFVQGSLVIDAFDGGTSGRVWHGASRAQVDPNHINDAELKRSVDALLASFPARDARAASPVAVAP